MIGKLERDQRSGVREQKNNELWVGQKVGFGGPELDIKAGRPVRCATARRARRGGRGSARPQKKQGLRIRDQGLEKPAELRFVLSPVPK
jgi:hypothetical protein